MKPSTPLLPVLLCALVGRWREGMQTQIAAARLLGLVGIDNRLTHLGGETLAALLLRTFTGPVVVVREQRAIRTDFAANFLAEIMSGRRARPSVVWLSWLLQVGWIELAHGAAFVTAAGRDALASYLLRGWRP